MTGLGSKRGAGARTALPGRAGTGLRDADTLTGVQYAIAAKPSKPMNTAKIKAWKDGSTQRVAQSFEWGT